MGGNHAIEDGMGQTYNYILIFGPAWRKARKKGKTLAIIYICVSTGRRVDKFLHSQGNDGFRKRYMDRLGHNAVEREFCEGPLPIPN